MEEWENGIDEDKKTWCMEKVENSEVQKVKKVK